MSKFFSKKDWFLFVSYLFLNIIQVVLINFALILFSKVLDEAVKGSISRALIMMGILVAMFLGSSLASLVYGFIKNILTRNFILKLKQSIDLKITNLSYKDYLDKSPTSYLSWYTNDISQLENLYLKNIFTSLSAITLIVAVFILLAVVNWILFLFVLASSLIGLLVPVFLQSSLAKKTLKVSEGNEQYSQKVKDILTGFFVFWSLNHLNIFLKKSQTHAQEIETKKFELNNAINFVEAFVGFLGDVSHCLFIGLAGYLVYADQLSVGYVPTVLIMLSLIYYHFSKLFNGLTQYTSSRKIMKKYQMESQFIDHLNTTNKIFDFKTIEFKNLSFGYDKNLVLKNLNLKFEKGKKYAIVGPSGIGKSTIFNLLMGIYDNYQGQILIDGVDLKELDLNQWRNTFFYLNQNSYLFADTIKNNISLWQPISDQDLKQIISDSNLDQLSEKIDLNLDSIADDSTNISGGEKQRISIARSLFFKKEVMLLDEFTSALDAKNRREIETLILSENKTILHITHQLDPLVQDQYDQIIKI